MSRSHNEQQKAYFSHRAVPRMTADRADTPYVRRHVAKVLRVVQPGSGELILDVGCGLGKYTAAIASKGHRVEGLDLTPVLIDGFRERLPDIPAHVGDAAKPPAHLLRRFDVAVGFFFLHHVEDLAPILTGVRSTMKPGGRAAFLEPNPLFLGYYFQVTLTPGMTWKGERGILRMRSGMLERAGREAGFTEFGCSAFGAMPPAAANRPWGRRVERGFEALPGWSTVGAFRLLTMA